MCVRNESFNTINARITINYDSIFQDHFPNEFMVEEGEGFMVLELDSLIPFENYSLNSIDFQTPTVDFIGELLETQVNYIGYLGEDTLVMGASFLEIPLTCAYDPNDKAGFPLGYTEHHYIENTQELEYLIRFQNTGNAPATDVKILDDIDEDLDLSTLKVIGNSHHVQTLINMDSREVEFLFENIFLPDSVNNESESHGFILFSVLPHNDLTTDTELENTAEIYFDNNPPIITNTTSHKIWGCELMTFFAGADSLSLCVGDEVSLNPETQFVEFLNWTVNDFSTQAETLEIGIESLDSYAVEVLYSNPYCQAESSIYLNVLGETPPEPFIEEDQFGLVTDNTSAYTYQWFLDGELIQGATQYFLNPSGISGEYQVEITNENGCSSISGPLDIDTSILELNRDGIKMYPNPSVEAVYVDFRTGKVRNVSVFNMNNQLVSTYTNTLEKNRLQINTLDYSKGVYSVLFTLENGEIRKVKLVVL